MLKNLKNIEFSKRLLLFVQALIIALFILTTVATFKGYVDALVALITGVFSLASIAFGFYFWKAKAENIRKYAKKLSPEEIEKVAASYFSIFKEDNEDEGI
jgi:heme O synthase-like polyprenyltransferase